jgi:hypothetical protein
VPYFSNWSPVFRLGSERLTALLGRVDVLQTIVWWVRFSIAVTVSPTLMARNWPSQGRRRRDYLPPPPLVNLSGPVGAREPAVSEAERHGVTYAVSWFAVNVLNGAGDLDWFFASLESDTAVRSGPKRLFPSDKRRKDGSICKFSCSACARRAARHLGFSRDLANSCHKPSTLRCGCSDLHPKRIPRFTRAYRRRWVKTASPPQSVAFFRRTTCSSRSCRKI